MCSLLTYKCNFLETEKRTNKWCHVRSLLKGLDSGVNFFIFRYEKAIMKYSGHVISFILFLPLLGFYSHTHDEANIQWCICLIQASVKTEQLFKEQGLNVNKIHPLSFLYPLLYSLDTFINLQDFISECIKPRHCNPSKHLNWAISIIWISTVIRFCVCVHNDIWKWLGYLRLRTKHSKYADSLPTQVQLPNYSEHYHIAVVLVHMTISGKWDSFLKGNGLQTRMFIQTQVEHF